MPRLISFRIPAMADLLRQLEYAPDETRHRHMTDAERLLADVDPQQAYPHDFVVFRITGYRPESGDAPIMLVGDALVHDLVALIQRLSSDLVLSSDDGGRRAVPLPEVAGRLQVSRKTLQRYRHDGLVCHYVVFPGGTRRLACFEDAIDRFRARHDDQLERAAGFTRIDGDDRADIIEAARELHDREGLTLNQTARVLAERHGRAHETVRSILQRHDRRSGDPVFEERGPLRHGEVRVIHRAWRAGVDVGMLADRFGKSRAAVQHAINRRRAELLHRLELSWIAMPTFEMEDASTVILSAPPVTTGLDDLLPATHAAELVDAAHAARPVNEDVEAALLAASNLLRRDAQAGIDALPTYPGAETLDEIETALRWCTMLKRRLVSLAVPSALRAVEQGLHRPLLEHPTDTVRTAIRFVVDVAAGTVETVDPGRDQRLDRVIAYATARAFARADLAGTAGRAAARHEGNIPLAGVLGDMHPWQPWLDPRPDLATHRDALPDDLRALVSRRYGWDGGRPQTCAALAAEMDITSAAVSRRVRKAEGVLRGLARRA